MKITPTLLLTPVILLVFLAVVGVIYEQIARNRAEREFPPIGSFVNTGTHRLHYIKRGENGPTILFESALGEGALYWRDIQNALSGSATTITYDRAGICWSEPDTAPRNCHTISRDLTKLIETVNPPKPYIVVAHSLGGLTMRPFIDQHRDDIAGVVFVDVSHPDQFDRLPKSAVETTPAWLVSLLSNTGVMRLLFSHDFANRPAGDNLNEMVNGLRHRSLSTVMDEVQALPTMVEESKKITSFGSIPLTVITAGDTAQYNYLKDPELKRTYRTTWEELQQDLLTLSSESKQVIAEQSGHYVLMDEPEVVIKSVIEMMSDSL